MPLNDAKVRNAKPDAKAYLLSDSGGMYLEVTPAGGKCWRMDYRFAGKRKTLSLGVYPDVPLAGYKLKHGDPRREKWIDGARDKRDAARKLLAAGIDPGESKQASKRAGKNHAENSFELIAREWLGKYKPIWTESNAKRIDRRWVCGVHSGRAGSPCDGQPGGEGAWGVTPPPDTVETRLTFYQNRSVLAPHWAPHWAAVVVA
jgi:hypothetical protein